MVTYKRPEHDCLTELRTRDGSQPIPDWLRSRRGYLSAECVAELLGLAQKKVYDLGVPRLVLGPRRHRFDRAVLAGWLEKRQWQPERALRYAEAATSGFASIAAVAEALSATAAEVAGGVDTAAERLPDAALPVLLAEWIRTITVPQPTPEQYGLTLEYRPRRYQPEVTATPAPAPQPTSGPAPCAITLEQYPEIMTPEEVAEAIRASKREVLEHPKLSVHRLSVGSKSPRWARADIVAFLCGLYAQPRPVLARALSEAALSLPGPSGFAIPRFLRVQPGTLYEGRRLPTSAEEFEPFLLELWERAAAEPAGR